MKQRILAALVIPLMLLPMVGFGYAHWTDSVKKDYYMHAGTVETDIVWWHVEGTNTYDVDCDGVVFGDELQIIPEYDAEGQVVKVDIIVDPIFPSWFLDLELIVHNKGRLSIKADEPIVRWTIDPEPYGDPITIAGPGPISEVPTPPFWQYFNDYFVWIDGRWVEVEPTTMVIKPSEVLRVKEFLHFLGQDYPGLQCNWLDLHVEIPFFQYIPGEPISSYPSGPYVHP